MKQLTLSLSNGVWEALTADACAKKLDPGVHANRILEDYLLKHGKIADTVTKDEIVLSRELIERAVLMAMKLGEKSLPPSITFDVIQTVSAEKDWIEKYEKLVGDNPFKHGNPKKHTINQNLGYYIKKALGAESATNADGSPMNVKVTGSIIQSYTPLK